ncbi:tetratricopeptide repeat protein [Sphingobacterium siyangense]|uniref:tetratricopeptide repeat protein n=1 Tax=Sphingobacterium siyangense TaxID=459529 RepID=UPI001962695E|nr:SEL1-like repeat protein [Sphingobacterium siyangense]QRY58989.1 SEL1-like repeat protein [Sphingobacterium siyangense]
MKSIFLKTIFIGLLLLFVSKSKAQSCPTGFHPVTFNIATGAQVQVKACVQDQVNLGKQSVYWGVQNLTDDELQVKFVKVVYTTCGGVMRSNGDTHLKPGQFIGGATFSGELTFETQVWKEDCNQPKNRVSRIAYENLSVRNISQEDRDKWFKQQQQEKNAKQQSSSTTTNTGNTARTSNTPSYSSNERNVSNTISNYNNGYSNSATTQVQQGLQALQQTQNYINQQNARREQLSETIAGGLQQIGSLFQQQSDAREARREAAEERRRQREAEEEEQRQLEEQRIAEQKARQAQERQRIEESNWNSGTTQFNKGVEFHKQSNYTEAFNWFQQAAGRGNAVAQFNLGVMYANGQGVPKDFTQAVQWYQKAAEQGNADAQFNLGLEYELGRGIKLDQVQAVEWYRKAAEQGDVDAQKILGDRYEIGQGVPMDLNKAMEWHRKAAERGLAGAQFELGRLYGRKFSDQANSGLINKDDAKQQILWFIEAAKQGHAEAQYALTFCLTNVTVGTDIEEDYAQAYQWLRKAAENGLAAAQCELALWYKSGIDGIIKKDFIQAFEWCSKAAAQGDIGAQGNLGRLYEEGQGTEQDYAKALMWYLRAADESVEGKPFNDVVQYYIGQLYEKGLGTQKNNKKAIYWYRKAVEYGDVSGEGNDKKAEKALKTLSPTRKTTAKSKKRI